MARLRASRSRWSEYLDIPSSLAGTHRLSLLNPAARLRLRYARIRSAAVIGFAVLGLPRLATGLFMEIIVTRYDKYGKFVLPLLANRIPTVYDCARFGV